MLILLLNLIGKQEESSSPLCPSVIVKADFLIQAELWAVGKTHQLTNKVRFHNADSLRQGFIGCFFRVKVTKTT